MLGLTCWAHMIAEQMSSGKSKSKSMENHLFTNEAEALLGAYELIRFAEQRVERLGSSVGSRGRVARHSKGSNAYQPLPAALGVKRGLHAQSIVIEQLLRW